jgi:hypothetical protein
MVDLSSHSGATLVYYKVKRDFGGTYRLYPQGNCVQSYLTLNPVNGGDISCGNCVASHGLTRTYIAHRLKLFNQGVLYLLMVETAFFTIRD